MVKDEELVWREREISVRLALVIREFDFVGAVQELHDGADLAAQEAVRGHVCEERDDTSSKCGVVCIAVSSISRNSSSHGEPSPPAAGSTYS